MLKNLGVFSIVAAVVVAALPHAAVADVTVGSMSSYVAVKPLLQVSLDDGRKGVISTNHKLYLPNAAGKLVPATAGHYMLPDGSNLTVDADSEIDQATLTRLLIRGNTM